MIKPVKSTKPALTKWTMAAALLALSGSAATSAHAQTSLVTAVTLALNSSPKVKAAADDVAKARAALSEARAVYVPAVSVGSGLGDSFGYSPYPPTLFTFQAQSLVYSSSQPDYIRSARAGVQAAEFSLTDTRQSVAEDVANTFIALDHDQKREAALHLELGFADRLVTIVEDRLAAGRDTPIEATQAQLTAAQLRESVLHTQDELANDRAHMALLMGVPAAGILTDGQLPALPTFDLLETAPTPPSAAVDAAFAQAKAKQEQAWGDARYLYRPQISLVVEYLRYASFTDSFKQIQVAEGDVSPNDEFFGVSISIPLFDRVHKAKARESAADAAHAYHDAESLQASTRETSSRLARTLAELRAHAEVATLSQRLAQQQLDVIAAQLNAPPVEGHPVLTPKDEQSAHIAEREKYLGVLDAEFQMRQAEINLLRQTGQLEAWLGPIAGATATSVNAPAPRVRTH